MEIKDEVHGAYDANWVKEFEFFYSHHDHSAPFVTRLLLTEEGEDVGFVHIRSKWAKKEPEVSEAYIAPPKSLRDDENVYLTCAHDISAYGQPPVHCVPFIMPDPVFSECVQSAMWICFRIMSEFNKDNFGYTDLPNIQLKAKGRHIADGSGLLFKHASRVFPLCGFTPFYFGLPLDTKDYEELEFLLYAYVESGLPVIIGAPVSELPWWEDPSEDYHSIVAIGHTMESGNIDGFIFHDESTRPYVTMSTEELKRAWWIPDKDYELPNGESIIPREAIAAAPREVTIPFQDAYQVITSLADRVDFPSMSPRRCMRPRLMSQVSFLAGDVFSEYPPTVPSFAEFLAEVDTSVFSSPYYWVILLLSDTRDTINGFCLTDATWKTDLTVIHSFLDNETVLLWTKKGNTFVKRYRDGEPVDDGV